MGKVYVKTKYDYGMQMEIPHNHNIAQAMYGFRELGAEIVPYHEISEIYDKVTKDDIVMQSMGILQMTSMVLSKEKEVAATVMMAKICVSGR